MYSNKNEVTKMNWQLKCRLCLTESPQRPLHALEFPELLVTLNDILNIEILPGDTMDMVCAICMEIISKVKFIKSNQNVIKECRGFCINFGIKDEIDGKDNDCMLIKTNDNFKTIEDHSNGIKSTFFDSTVSEGNQDKSRCSLSRSNECLKKCKVLLYRVSLDKIIKNNSLKKHCNLNRNLNFENLKNEKLFSTTRNIEDHVEKEPKIVTKTSDANIIRNTIIVNKEKLSKSFSTSTINSITRNIKWIPVNLSQKSNHMNGRYFSRLSFVLKSNKCNQQIFKLHPNLKISKLSPTSSSCSKVTLESLKRNHNKIIKSIFYGDSSYNQTNKKPVVTSRNSIQTSSVSAPPKADPFERINLPNNLDAKSPLERYRVLNSKIISNNANVKVLSENKLIKTSEIKKPQSTECSFLSTESSPSTLVGTLNPNNSNATELTVRFVRQSSKFCIIILLFGRIVTFNELDTQQLQCLKRLLTKNLKSKEPMNKHRFLFTHTPDVETLELLKILHIDHLLKGSH